MTGHVRGGRRPGALLGRERGVGAGAAGAASGSTSRLLGVDPGGARQPGPERVRHRASRPAGAATPTRTSCRTRPSRRPTARSPSRSARERQWPRFCVALGLPALADDPRFATNGDRVDHRAELRPTLAERFLERTTADWLAALEAAEIPAGPINDVLAAFASPEAAAARHDRRAGASGAGASIRQVGVPFELSATPASIRTPPPLLGEHTDEILAEARLRRERDRGAADARRRLTALARR